ncbi:superoxide dismutase [Cohnella caldifontis]|uniref:superoxide dismutase n=1 Tax=Cohnella caldifontis TaxID=3027471 RepID=UPI0023EC6A54|nr:superoxide dismutase [Cohnella sp. YIM B05605]
MLRVYGDRMPLRLLEEISARKRLEKSFASMVRAVVPGLEWPYVRLMQEWEDVFGRTAEEAARRLKGVLDGREDEAAADNGAGTARLLWEESRIQSDEFARQIGLLRKQSAAVRRMPAADALFSPILRETEVWRDENVLQEPDEIDVPQPADHPLRPEGTWSNPVGVSGVPLGGAKPVPIGGHTLPPLPYPYNALEPWIDEATMRIHHDKHHQSYVDGLNNAEKKLEEARRSGDFALVKHWERELAFNGAGHYLHTIFWDAMKPKGGGRPGGALAQELDRSFGGFEPFRKQFSEAANKVEGGGWAILVWSPRSRRLEILTAEKHQNLSQWDVVPLLPLDVWEHAYYLKHQNDRGAYVKDWWNVVNWPFVEGRYAKARVLQWTPY